METFHSLYQKQLDQFLPQFIPVTGYKNMEETLENNGLPGNITKGQEIMDNLTVDKRVTEEEFQNFMHRVTEVGKHNLLQLLNFHFHLL